MELLAFVHKSDKLSNCTLTLILQGKDKGEVMNELRFKMTEKMVKILKNVLIIKELLKSDLLDKLERKEIEEEKDRLVKQFIKEFQKNNKEEITKYNELKDTID